MAGHSQDQEGAYRALHDAMRASCSELRKVSELAAQADVLTSVRASSSGSVIDANMKELIRTASDNHDPPLTKRPSQKSLTQQQQQQQAGQMPHNAAVTHTVQLFAPPKHSLHVHQPSYARQYFGDSACEEVLNISSTSEIGDGSITLSPTSPHVMFDVPGGDLYSPTDDPPVVDLRMESNLRSSYVGLHRDDPDVINLIPARRPGPIQVGQLANLMDLFAAENSPEPLIKPRRLHVHDELGVSRYESLSTKEQSYSRSRRNSTEIGALTDTDGAHGHNGSGQPPNRSSTAVRSSETHQGGGSRSCQSSAEMSSTDMSVEQYRQQYGHHQPQPPPGVAGGLGGRLSGTLMSTREEIPKPPSVPRQERNPSPAHAHALSARMQPVPTHAVSVITATNSASTSSPAHLPPRPFTASNRTDAGKQATETNSTTKPPDTAKVPQIMQDIPLPTTATNSNSSISAVSVNLLMPTLKPLGLPPPAPSLGALSAVLNMQIPSFAPNASALPPVPRGREQPLGDTASTAGLAPLRTSQEPLDNSNCNPGPFPRHQLSQDTLEDLGQQQPGPRFRSPSPYRREGSLNDAPGPTSRASRSSASGKPGIDSTETPDAHTTMTFAVPVLAGEGRPPPAPKAERRISTSYDAPAWVDLRTVGLPSTDVVPPRPQMCRELPLPGLPLKEASSQSLPTVASAEYTVAGASTGICASTDVPPRPYGHSVSVSGTATAISTELSAASLRAPHRPPVPRSMVQSVDSALFGSLSVAAAGAGGAGGSNSRYASPMAPPRGGASSCLVRSRDASPSNRASVTGALGGYTSRDASPAARCGMTSLSGDPPPAYPSSGPSLLPSLRLNVEMSDAVATPAGGPLPGAPLFMPGDAFGKVRSSRDGQLQSSASSASFTLRGAAGAPGNLLPALPATATNRHTSRHNSRDPSPSTGRITLDPLNHPTSTANSLMSNAPMAGRAGGSRSSSVDRQQPTVTMSSNTVLGHGMKPLEPEALVPALPLRPGLERDLMQVAHEIRGGPAWRPNGGVTLPDTNRSSSSGSVLTSGGNAAGCDMSRGHQRAYMLNNPSQIPVMTQATVIIHRGHGFNLVKN